MMEPTQEQIEAVLSEFEEELTAWQRKLIANEIYRLIAAAALTPDKRREEQ